MTEQTPVAGEQLDALEHLLAAIDVDELTMGELDKLGELATHALDLWVGQFKRRAR